jgi:hypothetical protein
MGFYRHDYRRFLGLINYLWLVASEARQAVGGTVVGKYGWEVWVCGQAGRFASLSTYPCRPPAYPSTRANSTLLKSVRVNHLVWSSAKQRFRSHSSSECQPGTSHWCQRYCGRQCNLSAKQRGNCPNKEQPIPDLLVMAIFNPSLT